MIERAALCSHDYAAQYSILSVQGYALALASRDPKFRPNIHTLKLLTGTPVAHAADGCNSSVRRVVHVASSLLLSIDDADL